ncbi:uncharacterized protein (DUF58 family) [Bacillus sp. V-88]|jgi:uncharacterized protein (DUF58 family)|uniref:DUF58 domain-containing protein n=1 Tax=Rossellomorea vietnamensis TaxID=218284 RepID=A0A6I6UKT2_9BACI|nr:DUF58 domain-containing protein [Rossellomorea vietnamensis]OXS58169.1 hypothetical protein B1B00_14570 [Bacillus sp. DSM 27956]PRX75275.1 uncharacterized protein (DUF58 family) [Bacillus sp. V-88]QHE62638.1 DUF58 domain-containing protein [Rossellomorea vietnamensis]SLK23726.1 Uncharacterized conserved protein, DUF58 family, contains vWF domain [Bacillus sp. V-88]
MRTYKEFSFITSPHVLVALILILIPLNWLNFNLIVLLLSTFIGGVFISNCYLKVVQKKISWEFKKHSNSSSIDEVVGCYLEVINESNFPVNVEVRLETEHENSLVFVHRDELKSASSIQKINLKLPSNSSETIRIDLKGNSRGNHSWSNIEILIKDLLRLNTTRIVFEEDMPEFKVIPRILNHKSFDLQSLLQGDKSTIHSFFLDEMNIIGTKDYENESFRHIHWLATAKENKIVAKKYQKVHGHRYSIFLNLVGKGHFHLRKDMEELIEYTVSVCTYLVKEGCKVELWINYINNQNELLEIQSVTGIVLIKRLLATLSLLDPSGRFLSTNHFFEQAFSLKADKSLALVIGTPPDPTARYQWIQL